MGYMPDRPDYRSDNWRKPKIQSIYRLAIYFNDGLQGFIFGLLAGWLLKK